jgi:hypothetical protein
MNIYKNIFFVKKSASFFIRLRSFIKYVIFESVKKR